MKGKIPFWGRLPKGAATATDDEIICAIDLCRSRGESPSVARLAALLGYSPGGMRYRIKALIKAGLIPPLPRGQG